MIGIAASLRLRKVLRNPPGPLRAMMLTIAVLSYGATGFVFFELPEKPTLSYADGLWYTLVSVTTVGYGDYFPVTWGGRYLVALPVMVLGIGLLGYVLSFAAAALVEARTKEIRGMCAFSLKNHLVIFNYPSMTAIEQMLDELMHDPAFGKSREIVIVDERLEELPQRLIQRDIHFVRGNGARDETLNRAGIDRAAFAVILSRNPEDSRSDAENLAITLAVEARAKGVRTIVQCQDPTTEEILRKAGCDGIVCTARFEARFLGAELLNPGIQAVLEELASKLHGQSIYIVQLVDPVGHEYRELRDECARLGHVAMGLRRGSEVLLNPTAKEALQADDTLIAMGPKRLEPIKLSERRPAAAE